ncbi:hypothetical protein F511_12679 [Dorcoceras hygrometricum]|uniref:CCHC-type domain-containing protein n=1 Tax=Dorcoceras hygrometricum TaxID=472368 RepID=A0A2Z7D931_9LAMI|nr:hypothetical protein F511_12679 [Dorcoceras hygrometricum]
MNTAVAITAGAPQWIEKPRQEWTSEDKNKANLDNVSKDILYKMLKNNMFSKIQTCTNAKDIWEPLTQICEGNEETKENKLTVALQKFELIKMKPEETMDDFDESFSSLVIELARLNKTYSNRELALKVMREHPKEWDVKTMAMRESKDLNKMELHDLFANLKAYEFELEMRSEVEPSTSQPTRALTPTITEQSPCSTSSRSAEKMSKDAMALFIRKFGKFMRKHNAKPSSFDSPKRNFITPSDDKFYNCGRPGHFMADCRKSRRDEKKRPKRSNNKDKKEKKAYRKGRTEKAMVAEENKSAWADSDSEESSSGTSLSSESEDEVQ